MSSRIERIIVPFILLAGFGLRVFRLDVQSIWADEGFGIYWAGQDIGAMSGLSEADIHPPLYYTLLHFWMLLAGNSEYSTRFFSVFFGVLTLAVLFYLGWFILGRESASYAVLVAAVSPFFIYYSQETRMYSPALLFSLLSVTACWRWRQGRGSWAWLTCYVAAAAASVYSHHYTWLIVVFLNIFVMLWIWASRRRGRGRLAHWLLAQAALGLVYLPWVGVLLNKYGGFATPTPPAGLDTILYQTLVSFGLGYWAGQAGATPGQNDIFPDHWIVFSLALALLTLAVWGLLSGRRRTGREEGSLLGAFIPLYLALPIAGITLISWRGVDFAPRYLFFAAPAYYLLIGRGIASILSAQRVIGAIAILLVLGAASLSLRNYYFDPVYWRDDIRGMVQFINARWRDGDAVILNAYYLKPTFLYYYRGEAPVTGHPARLPTDWEEEFPALKETAQQYNRVWLVLWQDYYTDPQRRIQGWLDQEAVRFQHRSFRGGINVLGYLTRDPVVERLPSGQELGLQLGRTVEVAGYRLPEVPICTGAELPFTIYWRALRPLTLSYTVFVHLVDSQGRTWGQADSQPANDGFPTTRWPVGPLVVDERWIEIPPDAPPGQYYLEIGMYDFSSMKRLGGEGQEPSQYSLGPFQVLLPGARGQPVSGGPGARRC